MLELEVLRDVVKKMNMINIEYMLTGSLAMNFYAEPRMTRDIDIVIDIYKEDVRKLVDIFQKEYYISEKAVLESIKYNSSFNIIHNEKIMKIDFMIRKNNAYQITAFNRKEAIELDDFQVYIVSKEDLIIAKLIWAYDSTSEKQKRDIENILATDHDEEYLTKWLIKLELLDFFREFINERYI